MFVGTELQETVEACPEYFSPNVVPPEHCWHGDETNIPIQETPGNVIPDAGQDKEKVTTFLVQNKNGLSGEILSGQILFISYQK